MDLFTLRKGEMAWDNVRGGLGPLSAEMIKIKGTGGTWTCIYFDGESNLCGNYGNRPIECRILKCWDTAEITAIYDKDRLTRAELFKSIPGLWDLIQEHESRCSHDLFGKSIQDQDQDENVCQEIVQYDRHLRDLVLEKMDVDPKILDLLFGRPFSKKMIRIGKGS